MAKPTEWRKKLERTGEVEQAIRYLRLLFAWKKRKGKVGVRYQWNNVSILARSRHILELVLPDNYTLPKHTGRPSIRTWNHLLPCRPTKNSSSSATVNQPVHPWGIRCRKPWTICSHHPRFLDRFVLCEPSRREDGRKDSKVLVIAIDSSRVSTSYRSN